MSDWDDITNVTTPSPLDGDESHPCLVVVAGPKVGEFFPLTSDELVIGRTNEADIRLSDSGISRAHCRLVGTGSVVRLEDLDSSNGTFLNGKKIRSAVLNEGDKIQVGRSTILKFTFQDQVDQTYQQQLVDSALRDSLTRTFNRRYFLERIESEFRFSERHRQPLALLFLDVDHFKKINDNHGHLAGDRALTAFASRVNATVRSEDVLARYGGEEFAVLARSTDQSQGIRLAERIREAIERMIVNYEDKHFDLTVSIGVVAVPENTCQSAIEMIECADKALYQAKELGRNRVELYSDQPPPDDSRG